MPETWASSFSNPAWIPEEKFNIGLPSFYFNNNGFTKDLRDFVDFNGNNPSFDLGEFANGLESDFKFETEQVFHPVYFSLKLKNFRVGLEYSLHNKSIVNIPDDFFKFLAFGNSSFVDQTLNLGPEVFSIAYHKLSLPIAFETGKWTFGFRPSILKGAFSIKTEQSQLDLFTNPEYYQLELTSNFFIQSSGVLTSNTSSQLGIDFVDNIFENGLSWKGNTGVNLDLGVRYKHNEKLTFGLSATGIGQITWDRGVRAFSSNGTTEFNGLDLNAIVNGDSLNLESTFDDLVESFQLDESNLTNFETKTSKNIYLNVRYEFNEYLETAGIVYAEFFNGKTDPAGALNFRVKTGKALSVGLSYGVRENQWDNIGVNFLLELGPVQLFVASNNILNISNFLGRNSTNLRLGASFAFNGKDKVIVEKD